MLKGLLLLALAVMMVGCFSGPNHLTRSVDDWQNKNYEKSPWATTLLTQIVPMYPVVKMLAAIPDVIVLNPGQFWGYDAWDGVGVGFIHDNPEGKKKAWFAN